jgi:putative nucleotidyltransferase with HDIG domain
MATPKPIQHLQSTSWGRWIVRIFGSLMVAAAITLHLKWPISPLVALGLTCLSLAAGAMMAVHLRQSGLPADEVRRDELIVFATSLVAILGTQIIVTLLKGDSSPGLVYLSLGPIVAQAMLTSALLGPNIAVIGVTVVSLLLGMSGALAPDTVMAAWIAGVVGSHAVNPIKQRSDLLRAIGVQTIAHVILVAAVSISVSKPLLEIGWGIMWASVAALVATSVFWLGLAVLERLFGLVSDWSLLELCSPEHPLLRDLTLRAPGTYAHSVAVANLAENAARLVGANPVLVRTMAYFHDIGKTLRPSYFVENQTGDNPHDNMTPALSAQVIRAHVGDGVELARKKRMPKIIVDAIQQHHGTTLITYFYHRALTTATNPDSASMEPFFRYDGPRPQTREIAILHLADQVEAATRTCHGGPEECAQLIRDLIDRSRAEGQLAECDLTFRELTLITDAFINTVNALRHERVEYPELPDPSPPVNQDGDPDEPYVQSSP